MTAQREAVLQKLAEPNGPARIDLQAAWPVLEELVLAEGDAQALSAWVRAARQKEYKKKIRETLGSERMKELLLDPAPKVRKNAARLAGALCRKEDVPALIRALQKEEVRMVRPSQILALGALGEAETLRGYVVAEAADVTEEKHVQQEKEALQTALASVTRTVRHKVRRLPRGMEAELTVPEKLEDAVIRELAAVGLEGRFAAKGRVRLALASYKDLCKVRSWRELLFPLVTIEAPPERWADILKKRIGARFPALLKEIYEGEAPYLYRIELKGRIADRGRTSREIAAALACEALVNAPSDYDTELRVEQHGRYATAYVRLCTLPDPRFAYRKGAIAASIHPSVAAGVMQWAGSCFAPNAKVLDPCCGSGTMLIERARYDTCSTLFGIDISRQALRVAEDNFEAAGLDAKLILKDCLAFTAKERFDEVISNLPFGNRVGDHETNLALYDGLFRKLPEWLKPGGICVLYTMEVDLVRTMLRRYQKVMHLKAGTRTEAGGLEPGIFIIQMGRGTNENDL